MCPKRHSRFRDIAARRWIRAVFDSLHDSLGLTQREFGELVIGPPTEDGENRRDVVAKWIRSRDPQEPRFTYTRRIVTIAPLNLVQDFVGAKVASGLGLDRAADQRVEDRTPKEGSVTMTKDAAYVAGKLDEIEDEAIRNRAVRGCLAAIEEAHRPQLADAEKRSGRARST